MAKKFKDLKEGDSLWYINPITQEIDALLIKEVKGVPIEETAKHEAAKFYVSIEAYRNDLIVQSAELDKISTIKYYLDGRLDTQFALVGVKVGVNETVPLPVPYATEKKILQDYVNGSLEVTKRKYNG